MTRPIGTNILGSSVSIGFALSHLSPAGLEAFVVVYSSLSSRSEFQHTLRSGPSGSPIYLSQPERLSAITAASGYSLTTNLGLSDASCGSNCAGVYPVELRVANALTGRTVSQLLIPVPVLVSKTVSPRLDVAVVAQVDPHSYNKSFIAELESELLRVNVPYAIALSGSSDTSATTLRRISAAFPKSTTLTRAYGMYAASSMSCVGNFKHDGLTAQGSMELDRYLIGGSSLAVFPEGASNRELIDALDSGAKTMVLARARGTLAAILPPLGEPLVLARHADVHVLVADHSLDNEFMEAKSPLALQILEADLTQYYLQDPYQSNRITAIVANVSTSASVSRLSTVLAGMNSNPAIAIVGATQANALPAGNDDVAEMAEPQTSCPHSIFTRVKPVAVTYGAFASSVSNTSLPTPLLNAQGYLYSAMSNDGSRTAISAASHLLKRLQDDISLGGSDRVTLTAHTAKIPLSLAASLPFPITARVELSAPQLRFPSGSSFVVHLASGTQTLDIKVVGNTLGEFPMEIRVVGRDGAVIFHGSVEVDSTGFSTVGVVITVLAALVVLGWWVRTARRSRKRATRDGQ